ncbi:MAG: hypothetical protein DRJ42_09505 [Deltaproteobacteria bacterium]|nr:MAG: hypothetical protein DRJ42_09505 [Deltaproteobacteria bacterium]
MTTGPTMTELRSMSRGELEALWTAPRDLTPPRGRYRGHVLLRIDHATSRRPLWRWSERIGFEWFPFGVDFDRRLWFFFSPQVALGRFEVQPGPSRWRDTEAFGLTYDVSKLPRPIRGALYDEVKPLSNDTVLGIGGINASRGEGDHFFFALERA